ncbi:hypothetical protein BV898_16172 [Hypsibius exemplaris]|uniref:Integrator complex subunit 5 C-terminal domain-containing protein n=1 Tax=Hypsibius exemplaris TaxID=2072580 RepID=A0A9X6NLH3_HYPEX|nr:hypothetical protein BV898_16172 [Hypsibius exemplaris]
MAEVAHMAHGVVGNIAGFVRAVEECRRRVMSKSQERDARGKQAAKKSFLDASGLLQLGQIRREISAAHDASAEQQNISNGEATSVISQLKLEGASVNRGSPRSEVEPTSVSSAVNIADIQRKKIPVAQQFREFLENFINETLAEPSPLSLTDFSLLVSQELFNEANPADTDGLIRDLLILHRMDFLKALDHANWRWDSLFATEQWRAFFIEEVIPISTEPEAKVMLARIALKLFALAVLEETHALADDFSALLVELCRLTDFPAVFLWIFLEFVACEEMQPYFKGGVSQVPDLSAEQEIFSLYQENCRYLNTPSLVRFRPEPRELKFTPTTGILPNVRRKKFRTITVKIPQARRNQSSVLDTISLCCELFSSPDLTAATVKNPGTSKSGAGAGSMEVHDSPASPQPDDSSPSSPPPDATGVPQESPASPDLPEMRTSKVLDEKLPSRFRVEFKEGVMRMSMLSTDADQSKKNDGRPTYATIKRALLALGGWHWLAICLIDTLKPEESDKAMWWPEFQSVAFFNRNVHIVNTFKRNPIWMTILEAAAAHPDVFLYYSPLLRPIYISLYTHWETSMEGPTSARNMQAREQTLWLLRCLSKSKLIHEPYCYLGDVLDVMAPNEISSILWRLCGK